MNDDKFTDLWIWCVIGMSVLAIIIVLIAPLLFEIGFIRVIK